MEISSYGDSEGFLPLTATARDASFGVFIFFFPLKFHFFLNFPQISFLIFSNFLSLFLIFLPFFLKCSVFSSLIFFLKFSFFFPLIFPYFPLLSFPFPLPSPSPNSPFLSSPFHFLFLKFIFSFYLNFLFFCLIFFFPRQETLEIRIHPPTPSPPRVHKVLNLCRIGMENAHSTKKPINSGGERAEICANKFQTSLSAHRELRNGQDEGATMSQLQFYCSGRGC